MKLEEINDIPLLDLARLLHNDICIQGTALPDEVFLQ